MWRLIAKIVLWFTFACEIIVSLVGSIICFASGQDEMIIIGILVLFGGIIVSFISCCFLGMLIELCDNVAAIKNSIKQNDFNNNNTSYM